MFGKKKLYKFADKCDNKHQYKSILEAAMVSTTRGLTSNIPMSLSKSVPVNKPSTVKALCKISEILDAKQKISVRRLGAAK